MPKTTIYSSCLNCRKTYDFKVFAEDVIKYNNGAFVQDAFPYLSDDEREILVTRTCGPCFDKMLLFSLTIRYS